MGHEEHDKETKEDIQQAIDNHGWFVALFEADTATPAFAYTIGLWKTYGHPEIICFGLPTSTMHELLNDAGEVIKKGDSIVLDVDDFHYLDNYPVMFKTVEAENIRDYLGYARWYYDYKDFPAIQLFWPDKEGIYPWQDGYSKVFEFNQPLLYQKLDFKFFAPRNVCTFTVKQIVNGEKPILYVVHEDEDGSWQFLTGDELSMDDSMVVGLSEITKLDPTVNELFNMPTGQSATRKFIGDKWIRESANE